jgi:hypothetical protein
MAPARKHETTPPDVCITFSAVVLVPVFIVTVELARSPAASGVRVGELKVQVALTGNPEHEKVTVWTKPPTAVRSIFDVPAWPSAIVREGCSALREKSGATTVSERALEVEAVKFVSPLYCAAMP